jgi:hypothetical protein
MRLPNLFRRHVDDHPPTPIAIAFTMDDFAEMGGYTTVLAPYGVTWRVDAMDTVRPEVATIYRNGMPTLQLWRTTAGLALRCLDPKRDAGTIELPDQCRAWGLICALTAPAIWLEIEQDTPTGNRVMAWLLKWLGE